ncbi:MAG: KH domain-containing protein [Syntrophaceae bacterium]
MKELITTIVQSLVDKPEQVNVNEINGEQTVIFELRVAKEDMGKVIGKKGAIANAMRIILNAVSAKSNKRSTLEFID